MNTFIDPYENVDEHYKSRLNSDISTVDYAYLRNFWPQRGLLQTTINLLIHQLCHECRKRGLTDSSDRDEFERIVLSAWEPISANANALETVKGNVGPGTSGSRIEIKDGPYVTSSVQDVGATGDSSRQAEQTSKGKSKGRSKRL